MAINGSLSGAERQKAQRKRETNKSQSTTKHNLICVCMPGISIGIVVAIYSGEHSGTKHQKWIEQDIS